MRRPSCQADGPDGGDPFHLALKETLAPHRRECAGDEYENGHLASKSYVGQDAGFTIPISDQNPLMSGTIGFRGIRC
uniref:Uncharacterized protein n=1 Tax=Oryza glumipatula TaxID=40148 RepID=A0A0D9ZXN8_9ORYZ